MDDSWVREIFSQFLILGFWKFAVTSSGIAVMILVADYALYKAQKKDASLIGVVYNGNSFPAILVTWFFGALVLGYLCSWSSVVNQESKTAMLAIGLLWPVALSNLFKSLVPELPVTEIENTDEGDEQ